MAHVIGIVELRKRTKREYDMRYTYRLLHDRGVRCVRVNFVFLSDGSMVYDYVRFCGYMEALINAVEMGEDLDDMLSLIFPEKVDQRIMRCKMIRILQDLQTEK